MALRCVIGDESDIQFWNHQLYENKHFKVAFPNLYDAAKDKKVFVAYLVVWDNGRYSWVFEWGRTLCGLEVEEYTLMEARLHHARAQLVRERRDAWCWKFNNIHIFLVKSCYTFLGDSYSFVARRNLPPEMCY